MKIKDILNRKGRDVITVRPDDTVANLLNLLAVKNIGAAVVSPDGEKVVGVVSERDIVRYLAAEGGAILEMRVSQIMTPAVTTCGPYDLVEGVGHMMTVHRVRHVPVMKDDQLFGLVSIGDIVKDRIDRLLDERNHLLDYLHK